MKFSSFFREVTHHAIASQLVGMNGASRVASIEAGRERAYAGKTNAGAGVAFEPSKKLTQQDEGGVVEHARGAIAALNAACGEGRVRITRECGV